MNDPNFADWIQAFAAVAMLVVTIALWKVSTMQVELQDRQEVHFRRTERAYVDFNSWSASLGTFDEGFVTAYISNSGGTPAPLVQIDSISQLVGSTLTSLTSTTSGFRRPWRSSREKPNVDRQVSPRAVSAG